MKCETSHSNAAAKRHLVNVGPTSDDAKRLESSKLIWPAQKSECNSLMPPPSELTTDHLQKTVSDLKIGSG